MAITSEPVVQGDTTLVPIQRPDGSHLGAYSITSDGRVQWHPAVDVNRIVAGGQLAVVAIVAVSLLGSAVIAWVSRR
jgi:hypothetical protein